MRVWYPDMTVCLVSTGYIDVCHFAAPHSIPVRTLFDCHPEGGTVALALSHDSKHLVSVGATDVQVGRMTISLRENVSRDLAWCVCVCVCVCGCVCVCLFKCWWVEFQCNCVWLFVYLCV